MTTGEGDDYRGEMTREVPVILNTILSFCAIHLSF